MYVWDDLVITFVTIVDFISINYAGVIYVQIGILSNATNLIHTIFFLTLNNLKNDGVHNVTLLY
jgi:hypothetical protein